MRMAGIAAHIVRSTVAARGAKRGLREPYRLELEAPPSQPGPERRSLLPE
jgi:hypothetical protein